MLELIESPFFAYLKYLIKYPILFFEVFSGLIPILIASIRFKYYFKINKFLVIYAILIFLLEFVTSLMAVFSLNNHKVYLIFYILETIVLYMLYKNIDQSKKMNYMLILVLISNVIVVLNIFNNNVINDFSGSIQSITLILIIIMSFFYILNNLTYNNLFDSFIFWLNIGNLTYFSGKLFVFTIMSKVQGYNSNPELNKLWSIVAILLIFQRFMIGVGIFKLKNEHLNLRKID